MGSLLFGWAGDKCPTLCKCAIKCSTNPLKVGGGVRVVQGGMQDGVHEALREQQESKAGSAAGETSIFS